jgi:hypothetical protein
MESTLLLPCHRDDSARDFKEAGLYIRGTRRYYSILGAANGGVLKIFDRGNRALIWNDAGFVGAVGHRTLITTQVTDRSRPCSVEKDVIAFDTPFYRMPRSQPTPFLFLVLRLLNLTVMRSIFLGNLIKGALAGILIRSKNKFPMFLHREVRYEPERVTIRDVLTLAKPADLRWLVYGRPFVGIHMASARYFENESVAHGNLKGLSVLPDELLKRGSMDIEVVI